MKIYFYQSGELYYIEFTTNDIDAICQEIDKLTSYKKTLFIEINNAMQAIETLEPVRNASKLVFKNYYEPEKREKQEVYKLGIIDNLPEFYKTK